MKPLLAGSLLLIAPLLHAQVQIDRPQGGWRHSDSAAAGFRQQVNYPATAVNSEGQPVNALIRGQIQRTPNKASPARQQRKTAQKPATLVVNGVAMPLQVDDNGRFERPWAFGRGANSIEIRDGKTQSKQLSFYENNPARTHAKLRVVLSWDSDGTDLDLHILSPDGQHVFYGNRVAANGGALDVDVTTGYGPEIYANPSPPNGNYQVYVNYYGAGQESDQAITTAQVAIITQENTLAERQQVFRIPMRKPGELTLIKSFSYP